MADTASRRTSREKPSSEAKPSAEERETLNDLLRLQRRLFAQTANYLTNVSQLVASGSLEPREYVERSTKLWGDFVGAVRDWLRDSASEQAKKRSGKDAPSRGPRDRIHEPKPIPRKLDSKAIQIELPDDLFSGEAEATRFRLSIDGFMRRVAHDNRKPSLRTVSSIQPEAHFRLEPDEVTRDESFVELKLYNWPDNLVRDDVYAGILWASRVTEAGLEPRRFVRAIELKIVDAE